MGSSLLGEFLLAYAITQQALSATADLYILAAKTAYNTTY